MGFFTLKETDESKLYFCSDDPMVINANDKIKCEFTDLIPTAKYLLSTKISVGLSLNEIFSA